MSYLYEQYPTIARPQEVISRPDLNLAAMVDPSLSHGINPCGVMTPCMVKSFPVNSNVLLQNGNDMIVVFCPESGDKIVGQILVRTPAGVLQYVDDIASAADLSSYTSSTVVSSVFTIFSDTISTTNTTLSGRISAVGSYNIMDISPTWESMGRYVSDVKAAKINQSLAEGVVMLSNPNAHRSSFQTDTPLGHTFDWYLQQTPVWTVSRDTTGMPGEPGTVVLDYEFDTGLHFISGKYPAIMRAIGEGRNFTSQVTLNITCYDDSRLHYVNFAASLNGNNAIKEYVFTPPVNTTHIQITGTYYIGNTDQGVTNRFHLQLFTCNPLTADDTTLKYLTYVQGNVGDKNINMSGWVRYQMIPKPENMQLATYTRILAYNPACYEAFAVLLNEIDYFRLVATRQEYAKMLELLPMLTLSEVANLADNAAIASMGLLPLVRSVVSKLKKIGIEPAKYLRKGTSALHSLADKGVDKLEEMGLAYASMSITDTQANVPLYIEGDLFDDVPDDTYTCGPANAAVTIVGDRQPAWSLLTPAYASVEETFSETLDGDDAFLQMYDQAKVPEQRPSKTLQSDVLTYAVDTTGGVFPRDLYARAVQARLGSNAWQVFLNGRQYIKDVASCSFFYAVVGEGKDRKSLECGLSLTPEPQPNHDYTPVGSWFIDTAIDNKIKLEDQAGLTTMEALCVLLQNPNFAKGLVSLTKATTRNLNYTLYLTVFSSAPRRICDLSFTGALYAALWFKYPFIVFEAGARVSYIKTKTTQGRGYRATNQFPVMTWSTPSWLGYKLRAASFETRDSFFRYCFLTPRYMFVAVYLSSAAFTDQLLKQLQGIGLFSVDGETLPTPEGTAMISSLVDGMDPPFAQSYFSKTIYTVERQGDENKVVVKPQDLPDAMFSSEDQYYKQLATAIKSLQGKVVDKQVLGTLKSLLKLYANSDESDREKAMADYWGGDWDTSPAAGKSYAKLLSAIIAGYNALNSRASFTPIKAEQPVMSQSVRAKVFAKIGQRAVKPDSTQAKPKAKQLGLISDSTSVGIDIPDA